MKHKIPVDANYDELTEAYIRAEGFTAMPEPTVETWQRCTNYASLLASSSPNVPHLCQQPHQLRRTSEHG